MMKGYVEAKSNKYYSLVEAFVHNFTNMKRRIRFYWFIVPVYELWKIGVHNQHNVVYNLIKYPYIFITTQLESMRYIIDCMTLFLWSFLHLFRGHTTVHIFNHGVLLCDHNALVGWSDFMATYVQQGYVSNGFLYYNCSKKIRAKRRMNRLMLYTLTKVC